MVAIVVMNAALLLQRNPAEELAGRHKPRTALAAYSAKVVKVQWSDWQT